MTLPSTNLKTTCLEAPFWDFHPSFFHYFDAMDFKMRPLHIVLLPALMLAFALPAPVCAGSSSATPQKATITQADLAGLEPVAVIAPPPPPFELRAGDTLRETLTRWTRTDGYQLIWSVDKDYPVDVSMEFPQGTTFNEALATLLKAYWHKRYAITGSIYSNNVLVITGRQG